MPCIAPCWELDVECTPDWLFVRVRRPPTDADDAPPLAERIWAMLEEHGTRRLVLELGQLDVLRSYLVGQFVLLHKRILIEGGMMRLCGLSASNQQVLRLARLDDRFPQYHTREEAVMGCCLPQRPR
jgi:anti-anti-sigma factor